METAEGYVLEMMLQRKDYLLPVLVQALGYKLTPKQVTQSTKYCKLPQASLYQPSDSPGQTGVQNLLRYLLTKL